MMEPNDDPTYIQQQLDWWSSLPEQVIYDDECTVMDASLTTIAEYTPIPYRLKRLFQITITRHQFAPGLIEWRFERQRQLVGRIVMQAISGNRTVIRALGTVAPNSTTPEDAASRYIPRIVMRYFLDAHQNIKWDDLPLYPHDDTGPHLSDENVNRVLETISQRGREPGEDRKWVQKQRNAGRSREDIERDYLIKEAEKGVDLSNPAEKRQAKDRFRKLYTPPKRSGRR